MIKASKLIKLLELGLTTEEALAVVKEIKRIGRRLKEVDGKWKK